MNTRVYSEEDVEGLSGFDTGWLWAGGLATALVAGLVAVAGVIARRVIDVPILPRPGGEGWSPLDTAIYVDSAALAALAATEVMHLLLLYTARPRRFFAWIMVLVTLLAVLAPFSFATGAAAVATALTDLILGIAIGSLTAGITGPEHAAAPAPDTGTHLHYPY